MTATAPFQPRRILVSSRDPEPLMAWIAARRPDLELRGRKHGEETAEDLGWAEVLVGFRRPPVAGWGSLRWIHSIGAGVDAFLFRTDLPESVLVTRSSEDFGPQIAEYCVARALAVTQHLSQLAAAQHSGRWKPIAPEMLAGSRALVVGTGMVGQGIARAFLGLGVRVDGLSRGGVAREPFGQVFPAGEFAAAVEGARWLVLAAPLTEATFHFLDRDRMALCGGAYLISVGRGAVVEEGAIADAIGKGWLSGAALDVFETEPLPESSPFWHHPRVTISPHCSGVTTTEGAGAGFLECLEAVERGERSRWAVDRAAQY